MALLHLAKKRIAGVMVTLLTWSVVGYWFKTLSGQRHNIGTCYFSAAVLRSKRKDWLTQNQDDVSRVGCHIKCKLNL